MRDLKSDRGRRSFKLARLQKKMDALLRASGFSSVREVLAMYDKTERILDLHWEIKGVKERLDVWGDEWAKDDHPHAIRARAPAVGALC